MIRQIKSVCVRVNYRLSILISFRQNTAEEKAGREGIIDNLDFTRKNIEYILVYNSDKYPAGQQSPSRDVGYHYVARLANKEIVKFEMKFVKVMESEESIITNG